MVQDEELAASASELAAVKRKVAALQAEVDKQRDECVRLEGKLAEAEATVAVQERQRRSDELNLRNFTSETDDLRRRTSKAQAEAESCRKQVRHLTAQLEDVRAQLQAEKDARARAETQCAAAERRCEALEADANKWHPTSPVRHGAGNGVGDGSRHGAHGRHEHATAPATTASALGFHDRVSQPHGQMSRHPPRVMSPARRSWDTPPPRDQAPHSGDGAPSSTATRSDGPPRTTQPALSSSSGAGSRTALGQTTGANGSYAKQNAGHDSPASRRSPPWAQDPPRSQPHARSHDESRLDPGRGYDAGTSVAWQGRQGHRSDDARPSYDNKPLPRPVPEQRQPRGATGHGQQVDAGRNDAMGQQERRRLMVEQMLEERRRATMRQQARHGDRTTPPAHRDAVPDAEVQAYPAPAARPSRGGGSNHRGTSAADHGTNGTSGLSHEDRMQIIREVRLHGVRNDEGGLTLYAAQVQQRKQQAAGRSGTMEMHGTNTVDRTRQPDPMELYPSNPDSGATVVWFPRVLLIHECVLVPVCMHVCVGSQPVPQSHPAHHSGSTATKLGVRHRATTLAPVLLPRRSPRLRALHKTRKCSRIWNAGLCKRTWSVNACVGWARVGWTSRRPAAVSSLRTLCVASIVAS